MSKPGSFLSNTHLQSTASDKKLINKLKKETKIASVTQFEQDVSQNLEKSKNVFQRLFKEHINLQKKRDQIYDPHRREN